MSTWKTRRRKDDNIKMDPQELGSEGIDSIDLTHYKDKWLALVKAIVNLLVS